jgi:NTE family protein
MSGSDHRRIAIACQGGGSHTAFTAGVLTQLFEEELAADEVVGLSGTSGGAGCALLAWWALRTGDGADVGPLLAQFWDDNSATAPWEQLLNAAATFAGDLQQYVMTPTVSPYDNPFAAAGSDEFKRLLERRVDFASVEPEGAGARPALLVGAVDVLSGSFRTFDSRRDRITADTILASAAIPTLFRAVPIEDGVYWDGLFSQNPPIRELAELAPDEIWVIQINPSRREAVPRSNLEIADRRNELSGNLSLYQELHFIEKIDQLLESGLLSEQGPYRRIAVRIVELSPRRVSRALGVRTKLNRDPAFIADLIAHGRDQARELIAGLRFERAWRARDLDALIELVSEAVELRVHAPFGGDVAGSGREALAQYLRAHLSGLTLDLTRKQVVGDAVTWSVTIQPSGRRAAARVVLDGGRVASLWLGAPGRYEP